MTKEEMFHRIKSLSFPSELISIFALLENHLSRIEFVRDHIGLRDFLFISEEHEANSEPTYFACFDVDVQPGNSEYNFISMNRSAIYDVGAIEKQLSAFFRTHSRPLYLGIGFKETMLKQEDMFRIYDLLQRKEASNTYEAFAKVRRFPDWFTGKHPTEIQEDIYYRNAIQQVESWLNDKRLAEIMSYINHALEHNDQIAFKLWSGRYQLLKKNNTHS